MSGLALKCRTRLTADCDEQQTGRCGCRAAPSPSAWCPPEGGSCVDAIRIETIVRAGPWGAAENLQTEVAGIQRRPRIREAYPQEFRQSRASSRVGRRAGVTGRSPLLSPAGHSKNWLEAYAIAMGVASKSTLRATIKLGAPGISSQRRR